MRPLHSIRKTALGKAASRLGDCVLWARPGYLPFPVAARLAQNLTLFVRPERIEPDERRRFLAAARQLAASTPEAAFWDVGANVGLYSWLWCSAAPRGRVLALEPDPRNADCIRRTIERHGLGDVTLIEAAADERVGSAVFNADWLTGQTGGLGADGFITRHHGARPEALQVETVTLDSLLDSHPAPELLKIDVEGGEPAVLRGAERLLAERRPAILIEINHRSAADLLRRHGYRLEAVGSNVWAEPA